MNTPSLHLYPKPITVLSFEPILARLKKKSTKLALNVLFIRGRRGGKAVKRCCLLFPSTAPSNNYLFLLYK